MKTAIQIAKIRAVVLYIMQSFTQGVDYIKLFKILYFAQQDHLVKYGKVIVEDSFRALKHGPVPACPATPPPAGHTPYALPRAVPVLKNSLPDS